MKLLPTNFFILLPFIVAFLAFVIFYSRAIIFFGLKKLKRFTVIMLSALVVLIALYFIKYISDTRLIPTGIIDISYDAKNRIVKLICLAAVLIFAIISINKEKQTSWLTAVWVAIVVLNVAEVLWNAYLYINYKVPELAADNPTHIKLILEHTINPRNYLTNMIYPACWVLISALSLVKIRREKLRQVVHTYPSYSKIVSL
ncbi:hypothetical protein [Niastella sp. OAS944]|uniref:hypothetical protein n=1 Tax=Niastella sp. OAS944 TaxID=2664089 RepID=UPI00348B2793|nr:hypothetical protein [Chitinophagaceae bacterium OAS944]